MSDRPKADYEIQYVADLMAERDALCDEVDALRAQVVDLSDWVRYATHHPGCSGGYYISHSCRHLCAPRLGWDHWGHGYEIGAA